MIQRHLATVCGEELAEIEANPKSAHWYNVAEHQQIYKDEITSIWNRQRRSLTRPNITKLGDAYSDENVIVPEINNGYGDAAIARCASAIDPSRVAPGTCKAVIQAYLRQRRIIENLAYNRSANENEGDDLFDNGEDHMVDLPAETRLHLSDLKRALGTREADARNLAKSHMTTFSLPQPNKPKKEVIRRCGNCGQLGHMKTNKKCPRYFEFNPV
ncbi:hypothetical protein GGH94_003516 [Coemansia aciculifera]|uniref:Zinc knuckle domain-containing protein n=1 Tax=Coemansia aciculifera TaxID=417176 RepID=A0A9W8IHN4_9FUNG|nr:hypothetical protein GGH94_003516 [Coemansia aciculifera]